MPLEMHLCKNKDIISKSDLKFKNSPNRIRYKITENKKLENDNFFNYLSKKTYLL
jgi:hypothetical protein